VCVCVCVCAIVFLFVLYDFVAVKGVVGFGQCLVVFRKFFFSFELFESESCLFQVLLCLALKCVCFWLISHLFY
jgi:hypothetical protein